MKASLWTAVVLAGPLLVQLRPGSTGNGEAGRGRYLVHDVAQCVQCHSGRTATGELDPARLLEGGRVPFTSPWPGKEWAPNAPRIAGLLGYTDEEAVRLLTTGIARGGHELRPPMPPFRMTVEDARAVVAYLRQAR